MLWSHRGKVPSIDPSAFVAPTATVCGDVRIGPGAQIGFGAVVVAEGRPIRIGASVIVREHALLRATTTHALEVGDHCLVGPHASLMGCTLEDQVFVAAGAAIFHGARVGRGAEVRIHGVVHVNTRVAPGTTVPIGWVAVGDPAQLFPPSDHDGIWAVQKPLNFPGTVYGVERATDGTADVREITRRVAKAFSEHANDRKVED